MKVDNSPNKYCFKSENTNKVLSVNNGNDHFVNDIPNHCADW